MQKMTPDTSLIVKKDILSDGTVQVHGYKHAMVQVIAASIAANQPLIIKNAPIVDDSYVIKDIILASNGDAKLSDCGELSIDPSLMTSSVIEPNFSKKVHGSLYLVPAYGIRFGEVIFYESGGCQIGTSHNQGQRPTSQIYDVMSQFGFSFEHDDLKTKGIREKYIKNVEIDIMHFSNDKLELTGSQISGATKTAILCSIGSKRTVIYNPYLKADVQDLLRYISSLGFRCEVSDDKIEISRQHQDIVSKEFVLTDCVSEIMTYITLAVICDIELTIQTKNTPRIRKLLSLEFSLLDKMGLQISFSQDSIHVGHNGKLKSLDIHVTNKTIQSDHHPFFTLLLMRGDNISHITEDVWRNRFLYAEELNKIGANLNIQNNVLTIRPSNLVSDGGDLVASDTRAAAVLLLAVLAGRGEAKIKNIYHLQRGYQSLIEQIKGLGANLEME